MSVYEHRMQQLICYVANQAFDRQLLNSGLWFHDDIRNNFYYASYLFAAAQDTSLAVNFDREIAAQKAEQVLVRLLELQDRQPESDTYGHFPLHLGEEPDQAAKNSLPIELMGTLLLVFWWQYQEDLSEATEQVLRKALYLVYESSFYRQELVHFGHHDAKYTATKILFGERYGDQELLADGVESLRSTLASVHEKGMSEYGSLPWFWHWVQAFTALWRLTASEEVRQLASELLDELWTLRSDYYIGGAWAGPHARSLDHDTPADRNVVFDYVQFGDFELPEALPRVEYAGFLFYEAPAKARAKAVKRAQPTEVKRLVPRHAVLKQTDLLHSYVYITADYAVGGMLERAEEFDNEQRRWDVTFPIQPGETGNQLFFFVPATEVGVGDLRHQGGESEILLHKQVAMAVYPLVEGQAQQLRGFLPGLNWATSKGKCSFFGKIGTALVAVYTSHALELEQTAAGYIARTAAEVEGIGAVVVECLGAEAAQALGVETAEQLALLWADRQPQWLADSELEEIDGGREEERLSSSEGISYVSHAGDRLLLVKDSRGEWVREMNGQPEDMDSYQ